MKNELYTYKTVYIVISRCLFLISMGIGVTYGYPFGSLTEILCDKLNQETMQNLSAQDFDKIQIIDNQGKNTIINFLDIINTYNAVFKEMKTLRLVGCHAQNELSWKSLLTSLNKIIHLEIRMAGMKVFNFDWIFSKDLTDVNLDGNKLQLQGSSNAKLRKFSCVNCSLNMTDVNVLKESFNATLIVLNLKGSDIDEETILHDFKNISLLNNRTRDDILIEKLEMKKEFKVQNSSCGRACLTILWFIFVCSLLDRHTAKIVILILSVSYITAQSQVCNFENQNYPSLNSNKLSNLNRNCTEMSITHSKIIYVEYTAFCAFSNLKYLSLAGNNLTMFNIEGKKLETLDLSDNQITSIDSQFVLDSVNLKTLYLENNRLTQINWDLSTHVNLKKLCLNNNILRSIHLISPTLESLMIKRAKSEVMFSSQSKMKKLLYLDATDSRIRTMQIDICDLSDVEFRICLTEGEIQCPAKQNNMTRRASIDIEKKMKTGCELTTLRVELDDVVLSKEEYYYTIVSFYFLFITVGVLMVFNAYVAQKYIQAINAESRIKFIQSTLDTTSATYVINNPPD